MSNNIINFSALRDAGVRNRGKILLVIIIFLVIYFGGPSIKSAWNFFKEPWTKLEKYPTQYVYSALERNDSHGLLLCSATFVADDLKVPIGSLYGQIYVPYDRLTSIPQRGETFRLVAAEDNKYKPLMRSPPPTDAERNAPTARIIKPAPSTPVPTPSPRKR